MMLVPSALLDLLLFLSLCAIGLSDDQKKETPQKPNARNNEAGDILAGIHKGMTAAELIDLHGKPQKIVRQILFRRHVEQWTYTEPISVRVELQALRGQEARVVSVHSLRSKKP